jgi:hypothetical protein
MRHNRSFDADTQRQGAASRARKHTARGALPLRAGQLRRYTDAGLQAPLHAARRKAALLPSRAFESVE